MKRCPLICSQQHTQDICLQLPFSSDAAVVLTEMLCISAQSRKQHLAEDSLAQAICVQQHFDAVSIFFFTMHQTFIIGGWKGFAAYGVA